MNSQLNALITIGLYGWILIDNFIAFDGIINDTIAYDAAHINLLGRVCACYA